MRKLLLGAFCAAISLSMTTGMTTSANAMGDVCYGTLQASGHKKHDEREARNSAIRHWQKAAASRHGSAFSDWYYSGEREVFCNWDASGRHFWCSTRARPCGRR